MQRGLRIVWAVLSLSGCTQAAAPPASPPTAGSAAPAASAPPAATGAAQPVEHPEWRTHFDALHIAGTIALFDSSDAKLGCSDVALCSKTFLPASTFKIANSMIGLETGVLEDAGTVLPWDGQQYSVPEWNQDNTLRTAIRVSCVPCYQAIARQIGSEKMKAWVDRLDYGNHDISGGIDQFWLRGGMRISPLQQIDFLRRFEDGKLPISERTSEIVHDILTLDVGPEYALLGKTGLQEPPNSPELTAWFVGFVELGKRRVFFATLVNHADAGVDVKPLRRRVTENVLRSIGALPADAARAPVD